MKATLRTVVAAFLIIISFGTAQAQADPREILAAMIMQLQTGTPNPQMYGQQLWQTIAIQTGNSGVYPQLAQAGQVQNIVLTGQQQLPQGWLFAMAVQHTNGQSVWMIGLSSITNRIEYANFNVGAEPAPLPLPRTTPTIPRPTPPNPSPTPPSDEPTSPAPSDSEACRKFPNLC
ncbi:hypothetical protein H3H37_22315 [Duganella sp. LX20W]|uniref:Uncharacterized protein n=1 Tax=Rugamonas brunnea TaxID=2758569 RepID=A0A7W2EWF0_9BURK|nr:hypothetical protein [Rugamonas brunnea]MBA5639800.1 hypothetical protein [Rugamonas brunnea]